MLLLLLGTGTAIIDDMPGFFPGQTQICGSTNTTFDRKNGVIKMGK
jgi:hypothetical protein